MNLPDGIGARLASYFLLSYVWFSQGQWWNAEAIYKPFSFEFAVLLSVVIVAAGEIISKSISEDGGEDGSE